MPEPVNMFTDDDYEDEVFGGVSMESEMEPMPSQGFEEPMTTKRLEEEKLPDIQAMLSHGDEEELIECTRIYLNF